MNEHGKYGILFSAPLGVPGEMVAIPSCYTWDKRNVRCGCLRVFRRWGRYNAKLISSQLLTVRTDTM